MDVFSITETLEHSKQSSITNVNLDGFHQPIITLSLSKKGGTALYTNNDFSVFERLDLKNQKQDFESVWAEIEISKSKNIVCGCVYRHLRQSLDSFGSSSKLTK